MNVYPRSSQQDRFSEATGIQNPRQAYNCFFEREIKVPEEDHGLRITNLIKDSQDNSLIQLQQISPELQIKHINHSVSYKVLFLTVQLNRFQFTVSIINQNVNSRAHLLERKEFKYSDLYSSVDLNEYKKQEKDFVVKCFKIDPSEDLLTQFGMVFREYCYYRLASFLRIGPKLAKPFGFDIQITDECIQFAMDKYDSIQKAKPCFFEERDKHKKELKQKLYRLHFLKITHNNIHPFNLLYNSQNQEFYFSDFCFCRFIASDVGTKVKTKFSGALNYVHTQMFSVFDRRQNQVDLYLNDIHCLEESFNYLFKSSVLQKKLIDEGKRYRVQEIRDVYQDYGTLYNNVGSFYKKIDEVYDYLLDYYNLLKMFLSVHLRQDILNNRQYMQAIESFPQYYLRIIQQYSPSQYIEKIKKEIQGKLGEEVKEKMKKLCEQFSFPIEKSINLIQRQLIRKQQEKILETVPNDTAEFLEEFNSQRMTNLFNFEGDRYVRQAKIQRKIIVNNPIIISKLDKYTFYKQFLRFIEIRQIRSTYHEKVKACQCFLLGLKLQNQQLQVQKKQDHPQLEYCLKHTLDFCFINPCNKCQGLIPQIVTNLVITSSATEQEILIIIEKISELNIDSVKKVIMLFNVYCGIDWIQFKAVHTFQYKAVSQNCISKILQVLERIYKQQKESETLHTVIKLIVAIIYSDERILKINGDMKRQMIGFSKQLFSKGTIDQMTYNRLISLICFNTVVSQHNTVTETDITLMMHEVQSLSPKIFDKIRISSWHLRVYSLLEQLKSDSINMFSIKNRFWMTLQVPKLLNKYKLFYNEQRSLYNREEIPRLVKTLQNLCTEEKYKFCQNIILEWLYWLQWLFEIKEFDLYQHYLSKLKNIYTIEALQKIPFPSTNNKEQYFTAFYHNCYQIVILYIAIYQQQQGHQFRKSLIQAFIRKLEQHCQSLQFEGSQAVKNVVVNFINFIRLQLCFLMSKDRSILKKDRNILKICKQNISRIKRQVPDGQLLLLQYEEALIKRRLILGFTSANKSNSVNKSSKLLTRFMNSNLIPYIFVHHNAYYLLIYINKHTFGKQNRLNLFLQFQNELLLVLNKYPLNKNVQLYTQALSQFLREEFKGVTDTDKNKDKAQRQKINSVIKGIKDGIQEEESKIKSNKYCCLLLSFFLQYHLQIEDDLFRWIVKKIASYLGQVSEMTQKIILNQMFTSLLTKGKKEITNPNLKKERRKTWYQTRSYSGFILEENDRKSLPKRVKIELGRMKKKSTTKVDRLKQIQKMRQKWFNYLESDKQSDDDDLQDI